MNNPAIHNQLRISQDRDILNGAEDGSPQEKGGCSSMRSVRIYS
jgi:hypothetical protein